MTSLLIAVRAVIVRRSPPPSRAHVRQPASTGGSTPTSRRARVIGASLAVFAAGYLAGSERMLSWPAAHAADVVPSVSAQPARVFELRSYTAAEGKFDDLVARFRDHTLAIFESHGMTNVGYWIPQDEAGAGSTLVYLLAHPSREAADANWRAFGADPEWRRVAEESQRNGRLIAGLERTYLDPTDFSPMR